MELKRGVNFIEASSVDGLLMEGRLREAEVYVIDTASATSRADLFDEVRRVIPLDPPLVGSHGWEALLDSIWNGLESSNRDFILIIWLNSGALKRLSNDDYANAVSVMADVAESLGDSSATMGHPKTLCVYLSS